MFTDELNRQQWWLIAGQKSAEGIVLESQEGPNNEEDAAVWLDYCYSARRCLWVWGESDSGFQIWETNSGWYIRRSTLTIALEGRD